MGVEVAVGDLVHGASLGIGWPRSIVWRVFGSTRDLAQIVIKPCRVICPLRQHGVIFAAARRVHTGQARAVGVVVAQKRGPTTFHSDLSLRVYTRLNLVGLYRIISVEILESLQLRDGLPIR